jgi:hypothetical protein
MADKTIYTFVDNNGEFVPIKAVDNGDGTYSLFSSTGGEVSTEYVSLEEQTEDPDVPETGFAKIYVKSDGIYLEDDEGNVSGPLIKGEDYICIEDQKAAGTQGGTFTAGSWQTRTLNTEVSDTAELASVASNQITLAAGTYYCQISAPACGVGGNMIRLQNITNGTTIFWGTTEFSQYAGYATTTRAIISGKFTLNTETVLEVQHKAAHTYANAGFGEVESLSSDHETYTRVEFWKERTLSSVARENYILLRDKKAHGTNGGTFTQEGWRTRDLNDEVVDTGGHASISSNQIILAAGTYRFRISAPALRVGRHTARLFNITSNAAIIQGTTEYSNDNAYASTTPSIISGRVTLNVTTTLEVQHYCDVTWATLGFGAASETGTNEEIYTVAEFWKEVE